MNVKSKKNGFFPIRRAPGRFFRRRIFPQKQTWRAIPDIRRPRADRALAANDPAGRLCCVYRKRRQPDRGLAESRRAPRGRAKSGGRGSGIGDRGSGIGDRGSGIRDQGSGIRDQGSGIRDQKKRPSLCSARNSPLSRRFAPPSPPRGEGKKAREPPRSERGEGKKVTEPPRSEGARVTDAPPPKPSLGACLLSPARRGRVPRQGRERAHSLRREAPLVFLGFFDDSEGKRDRDGVVTLGGRSCERPRGGRPPCLPAPATKRPSQTLHYDIRLCDCPGWPGGLYL
jgi:hypothetical protein